MVIIAITKRERFISSSFKDEAQYVMFFRRNALLKVPAFSGPGLGGSPLEQKQGLYPEWGSMLRDPLISYSSSNALPGQD